MVVGELDLECGVFLEFGGAGAANIVRLVETLPGEEHRGATVLEVEACLHGAEGDLAVAVGLDDQHGGLDQVQVVAVPDVGLDDPPAADQLAVHRRVHGGASASRSEEHTYELQSLMRNPYAGVRLKKKT